MAFLAAYEMPMLSGRSQPLWFYCCMWMSHTYMYMYILHLPKVRAGDDLFLKSESNERYLSAQLSYLQNVESDIQKVKWYYRKAVWGVYILRISGNEKFHEDCTRDVATLGMWVWFSINFANRSNFEICELYVHPSKITICTVHVHVFHTGASHFTADVYVLYTHSVFERGPGIISAIRLVTAYCVFWECKRSCDWWVTFILLLILSQCHMCVTWSTCRLREWYGHDSLDPLPWHWGLSQCGHQRQQQIPHYRESMLVSWNTK